MKHEYVNASDLIQTDMRSGNEKKLDAMLDERGANEMGAETAVVLRNIALELMAQLEQDEKTRPASDADMAVYHEISSNYNKDRSALAAQIHPRTPGGEMTQQTKAQRLVALDSTSGAAAALLLRQDELLKQAFEALDGMLQIYGVTELTWIDGICSGADSTEVECCNQARDTRTAIRNHLEAK